MTTIDGLDTLIGRLSALTTDELTALTNTFPDLPDAAWDAWSEDVWAAFDAADEILDDLPAAPLGAIFAVRALFLRRHIGQGGFSQQDYDQLASAWRQVIGPVHAHDVHRVAS